MFLLAHGVSCCSALQQTPDYLKVFDLEATTGRCDWGEVETCDGWTANDAVEGRSIADSMGLVERPHDRLDIYRDDYLTLDGLQEVADDARPGDSGALPEAIDIGWAVDTAPTDGFETETPADRCNLPGATVCDDGNACTTGDVCLNGRCVGIPISCDDMNECTTDVCDPDMGCLHVANSLPCDDSNPCTVSDGCQGGQCVPGPPLNCNDANPCTFDYCDPASGGCVHLQTDWPCDDSNACTTLDQCVEGLCIGVSVSCDDFNPCTVDSCKPEVGCIHVPVEAPCDDFNACTEGDVCIDGKCMSGPITVSCDDGNECTTDICNPENGQCSHVPNLGLCDDSNPCTSGDHCVAGVCIPGEVNQCQCQNDADCALFDDDNKCNGTLFCDKEVWPYKCRVHPASVVKCSPVFDSPCVKSVCVESTGICVLTPVTDGTPCSDDDPCTVGDKCVGGECDSGAPVNCDDKNPCTVDICEALKGCTYKAATGPCDDGNPCTVGDICQGGYCFGIPKVCDDGNPCTTAGCNPQTGQCEFVAVPGTCDDGNPCTVKDECVAGVCIGTPITCDDKLVCTADWCDPNKGCGHTPLQGECDDGNACTVNDQCIGVLCKGEVISCDDGNPCTDDICDPAVGCIFEPNVAPCDDGDACTYADVCKKGTCTGLPVSCDDGNPCTAEWCHSQAGCVKENLDIPCTDFNPCTISDWCIEGHCTPGTPVICDDQNECTLDYCDPQTGECRFDPQGKPCDDGSLCTTSDLCINGICTGFPVDCNDLNPCTSDSCNEESGCHHDPLDGAFCDDMDVCSTSSICKGDKCVAVTILDCDDHDPCTLDSCDHIDGCYHVPVSGEIQPIDGDTPPLKSEWSATVEGACPVDNQEFSASLIGDEPALELVGVRDGDCLPGSVSVSLLQLDDLMSISTPVEVDLEWNASVSPFEALAGALASVAVRSADLSLPLYSPPAIEQPSECGNQAVIPKAERRHVFRFQFDSKELWVRVFVDDSELPDSPFDLSALPSPWRIEFHANSSTADPATCPAKAILRVFAWSYVCN